MDAERYNALLKRLQNLDTNLLNDKDLDILELFAQTRYLTVSDIEYIIKSTKLKRAYKNLHRIIRKFTSWNLIEETPGADFEMKRHNEKFFKLRDEGIYVLFLKRLQGILLNQILVKRGESPLSYIYNFLNNYNDNFLFELFLYPYFEKRTISFDNDFKFSLVVQLFNYLNERLDLALKAQFPMMITKFSWNNIPGRDAPGLVTSLKEVFELQDAESVKIQIEKNMQGNVIKIIALQWSVVIELNIEEGKAVATLTNFDDNSRKYEYKIAKSGSEISVGTVRPPEDPIKRTLDYSRSLIEQLIYELVSHIDYESAEGEQNNIILAQDTKFMSMLEEIYKTTHNQFERGYNQLMGLRTGS